MHARLTTSQYPLDKVDEALQIYRESILPELRRQPGFKGVMGLVDRSKGKAISLTLWESEADALASGAGSAYMQEALAKFGSLFVAAPVIETYEVGLQE